MRIAIIGDRGIPARHSGFSTLVEVLATRLVAEHGMDVTVYCRTRYYDDHAPAWRGVRRVFLPCPGGKSFESLIHSALSIAHALTRRYDVVFVLDPGNAPLCPPLRLRGFPLLIHTDGLGWQRRKWSRLQQRYYKWSEWVSARVATWLVTDARAMRDYYRREYRAESSFIPYSGAVGEPPDDTALAEHGLTPGGFDLVVARLEPENNVDLIIREHRASPATVPLVVVGGSPYDNDYARAVFAESDGRVRCIGPLYRSAPLNGLYRACRLYLHGHEVGGTNPSLLRAMQAGAPCAAVDVVFTREVLGEKGLFFAKTQGALAALLAETERDPTSLAARGTAMHDRATALYRWDAIVAAFADLFRVLATNRRPAAALVRDIYRPEDFTR